MALFINTLLLLLMQCDTLLRNIAKEGSWSVHQSCTTGISIGERFLAKIQGIISVFRVAGLFICIGKFMKMPTVKFQRAMRFTISTRTRTTITRITLWLLCVGSTSKVTGGYGHKQSKTIWTEFGLSRKRGIQLQRAKNGMLIMLEERTKNVSQFKSIARSVARALRILPEGRPLVFVPMPANQNIVETVVLTILRKIVQFAAKPFKQANTNPPQPVPEDAQTLIGHASNPLLAVLFVKGAAL